MLEFYLFLIDNEEERVKFEDIYYKYGDSVYSVAMGFLKDHQLACEVLSKVCETIAIHINEIDTTNSKRLDSFIYKVVKNTSLNYLNDRHVKAVVYSLDDFEETILQKNLEDTIVGNETYKKLVLTIYAMPEIYRDVLSMYYVDGYSAALIAKALSRPITTVRTQIRRGTAILKKAIKEADLNE